MVEVKFGICNNGVILKISTIGCARKTHICFAVFLFLMEKVRFHVQGAQSKSLILLQTYEIKAVVNHG
jgi:hypothetical protein